LKLEDEANEVKELMNEKEYEAYVKSQEDDK